MNFASLFDHFHVSRAKEFEKVSDDFRTKYAFTPTDDMPKTSKELASAFSAAQPIVHGLSVPVEMRYGMDKKKPLELTSVREVRKSEHGFLLKGYSVLYNRDLCYLADAAQDIRIGPDGTPVDSFHQVVDKYAIFHGEGYAKLRKELHFLLYLARQDGLFSPQERDAVAARIIRHDVPEAHRPLVEKYFQNSFITADIFNASLDAMKAWPKPEIHDAVEGAEAIIRADGKISADEQNAFNRIYATLSAA